MSLNLHLQCQQQQQPVTIEPLDIDFGATLFNVPMDELQSAIKEQENTMNNPPPSQDMSPAQLNVHAQPQPQLQQPHLHHQPESFQRPQVQHQLHQSLQPVLSPDPHVHTMQPDQPVPPILLRSNSTPAVSRPRVGPIPASIHPFGFPANDDSVLYTPSHPFGSMAQHALNMYAMTDKITQDLSIPQQYYQMTPQAQLATTLQQLQVQIQMVQLQHPSSNQEPKSSQHSLPQSQPQHPLPIHPHHRHPHSQGPPPPPPQVLSQQHQQLAQPLPHHPQPQPSMVPSHAFFNEPEQMLFDEQTAISEYLNTSNAMGDDSGDTSMAQATNFAEDIPMLQGGGSDGGSGGSSGSQPPLGKENTDIRTLMDFSPFAGHMQPSHVSDVAAPSFQDTVMDSAAVDSGAAGSNMSNTATAATLFSMDSSGIQTPTMGFGANSMPSFDQSPSSEGFSGGGGGNIENPPKPSMLKQQRRSIQVLPSHYHQQQQQQQHYQQSEGQFHSLPHFRPEGISPSPLSSATQQPQHPHQQDQQAAFVWASGHQTPTYIPNGLAHLDLMIPQQQQQQQFQSHPGAAMQQFQSHQQTFDIHPHHTFQQTPLSFPSIMPQQLQQGAVHNNNINDNVNNLAHHRYEPAPQSGPELAHSLPSTFSMEQAAHVQTHQRLQFEQQMQQLQQQQHQHQ
ncbi:hypothetical protein BGZ73_004033 [Actinomortierella ambigua]|nr:hypothetical protein BGZ73_004033 [Actinomortierella ambigua]